MSSKRPYLILDVYLDERGGAPNIERLLEGRPTKVVRVAHEPFGSQGYGVDPADFTGLILTGSAASVLDEPTWLTALEELVRRAAESDVPTLGICFGHQVLARSLLGPRAVRRAKRPELGWLAVRKTSAHELLEGLPEAFSCFVSHHDEVTSLPRDWPVLASSADCAVQAFQVAARRMWGVQFHAEMPLSEARELMLERAAKHPGSDAEALLKAAHDSTELGRRILKNFTRRVESSTPKITAEYLAQSRERR